MNIIKKIQKKQKRKKLMKQKAKLAQEQAVQVGTSRGKSYHRRKLSDTGKTGSNGGCGGGSVPCICLC